MPLSPEEYRDLVLALADPQPEVQMPVEAALGHVLATNVAALVPVPAFTNSAMDGFAVHANDLTAAGAASPVTLPVDGEVAAGDAGTTALAEGFTRRIMTGAPIPPGADAVVKVEDTSEPAGVTPLPQTVTFSAPVSQGKNIRQAAENVQTGEVVLEAGTVLNATAIAAAISVGYGTLPVIPLPRVGVIATGSELVQPGASLSAGKIPDSNSPLVRSLLRERGFPVVDLPYVSDQEIALQEMLRQAARDCDLIITTGGISAGAYDVVKQVASGESSCFTSVSMQPGKPQGHGLLEDSQTGRHVPFIALPGNPVSVFVSFQVFVLPLLRHLSGRAETTGVSVSAQATLGWNSPAGRRQFVPCAYTPAQNACELGTVTPTHALGSGSHLIASLHRADVLAVVAEDIDVVNSGDIIEIIPLNAH